MMGRRGEGGQLMQGAVYTVILLSGFWRVPSLCCLVMCTCLYVLLKIYAENVLYTKKLIPKMSDF